MPFAAMWLINWSNWPIGVPEDSPEGPGSDTIMDPKLQQRISPLGDSFGAITCTRVYFLL